MRPLLNTLYEILGKDRLSYLVNILLISSVIFAVLYFLKRYGKSYGRLIFVFITLAAGVYLAMGYERPEERMHFLEYAVLGYLVFMASGVSRGKPVMLSFGMVTLIGSGDEAIQWFLPNRVGDMRDVFMNCIGGLLGIATAMSMLNNEN